LGGLPAAVAAAHRRAACRDPRRREAGRRRVSVCAWLVDVYCLGVKNDLGPTVTHRGDLSQVVRNFFAVFGTPPVAAPLELAQHLVLGVVGYDRGLGFEPAEEADFADTRGHLGPWRGPSAIRFGGTASRSTCPARTTTHPRPQAAGALGGGPGKFH
jgi:hypothetical protein